MDAAFRDGRSRSLSFASLDQQPVNQCVKTGGQHAGSLPQPVVAGGHISHDKCPASTDALPDEPAKLAERQEELIRGWQQAMRFQAAQDEWALNYQADQHRNRLAPKGDASKGLPPTKDDPGGDASKGVPGTEDAPKGQALKGLRQARGGSQSAVPPQFQADISEITPPYPHISEITPPYPHRLLPHESNGDTTKAYAPDDWTPAPFQAPPPRWRVAAGKSAGGLLGGAVTGALAGAALGAAFGALVGTLACPGAGTAAGAIIGAKIGAASWAGTGGLLGGSIGGSIGWRRGDRRGSELEAEWLKTQQSAPKLAPLPSGPALKDEAANKMFHLDRAAQQVKSHVKPSDPAFKYLSHKMGVELAKDFLLQQAVERSLLGFRYDHKSAVRDVRKFAKRFSQSLREWDEVRDQVADSGFTDPVGNRWCSASAKAGQALLRAIEQGQPEIVVAKAACELILAVRRYAVAKQKALGAAVWDRGYASRQPCRAAMQEVLSYVILPMDAESRKALRSQFDGTGNPVWALREQQYSEDQDLSVDLGHGHLSEDPEDEDLSVLDCLDEVDRLLADKSQNGGGGLPSSEAERQSDAPDRRSNEERSVSDNWHLWNAHVALAACRGELDIDRAAQAVLEAPQQGSSANDATAEAIRQRALEIVSGGADKPAIALKTLIQEYEYHFKPEYIASLPKPVQQPMRRFLAMHYLEMMSTAATRKIPDAGYTNWRFDALLQLLNSAPKLKQNADALDRNTPDIAKRTFTANQGDSVLKYEDRCWVADQIYLHLYNTYDEDTKFTTGYVAQSVETTGNRNAENLYRTKLQFLSTYKVNATMIAKGIAAHPPGN